MRFPRSWAAAIAALCLPLSILSSTAARAQTAGASGAAATVQTARYDFEDGTAQGWAPRGSGVSVQVVPDAAHSGGASLLTTGRTETWHGASVTPPLEKGVTYTITAYARLAPGTPDTTIALTVQRTPDGGETTYERVGAATVTATGWTEISGTYSFATESPDLQLYAESTDATAAFHLDDITITSDTEPGRSGVTSDFETGTTQGRSPRASATLTVTGDQAHGGTRGLLTTGRSASWDGPALSVLGKMAKGSKYTLSVWVRLGAGTAEGELGLSVERRLNGTASYDRVAAPTAVAAGGWTELKGSYTLAHDVDFLSVYVESPSGTFPFHLDDFTLAYVPAKPVQTDIPAVKDVLPFDVGAAAGRAQTLGEHSELLARHFDSLTPGNALEWDATEPREGEFTFAESDYLVDHALRNGMKVRGHTLAWHSQTPDWVFKDGDRDLTATPADKALLLKRLTDHIRAVMGRYKGKIGTWDVVNEVVDENRPDGMRRSPWFTITGYDFIRTAFRVARQVDPAARLVLNDYNTELPRKRRAVYDLVRRLRAEGVPIDAVGHQVHVNIEYPAAAEIEKTIELFAGLGVDQQVTELDVSVYTDFVSSYATVPAEVLAEQGHRYKEIFDVFRRQASHLSSVTLWGLADDDTWLSSFPITRLDPPLLFDDELQAKPAYWGVVDPARLPPLTRRLDVPQGTVRIDGARERQWDLLPGTPVARVGAVAARFQARWSAAGLAVLAEVDDGTRDRADTVTLRLGGAERVVKRDTGATWYRTAAVKDGYRAEALLPAAAAPGGTLLFELVARDATSGARTSWTGELTLTPAVKLTSAAKGTPVVDGVPDALWTKAPEVTTATWVQGGGGATAKVRALWDAGHLYVLARVTDAHLSEESQNAWEQDSVEIFADPGNGKTKGYDDDDGQYRVSFTGRQTVGGTFDAAGVRDNLVSAAKTVPGGYVVEASIALPTITPSAGDLLGFDVQVNDATGPARTAVVTWNDSSGRSYSSTAGWGVLELGR
ncbi:beta-xylanase [Sphaerisporangium melleum]|uniref:Beta-xylanase n=1 Tax=Sphaerisporangium melleum TaxID=321316 RepID=A0A917R4H2_9ACTN|nr:endo-1,4-beta-xylanase [Sphaerisporangium melleum]GGK90245.1 beta-xylanase [Sphaerisporangium melleum]GII72888.1 beta-xylanase [Sphaerisporangium melleum]